PVNSVRCKDSLQRVPSEQEQEAPDLVRCTFTPSELTANARHQVRCSELPANRSRELQV
ncbi:hypothetical protein A2U01_0070118, partial [Trifolium medium]|nr:hypothetical protein [Trifolium medium]